MIARRIVLGISEGDAVGGIESQVEGEREKGKFGELS